MTQQLSELHPSVSNCVAEHGIAHKVFECDPALADTAAFCEHYGFEQGQAANAIIVATKTDPPQYACCVALATTKLDVNKKVCQLMNAKKASFATAEQTLMLTGMQIGGVTPFGLPPSIPVYIDSAVLNNEEVVMGGGNRSTKLLFDPKELSKVPYAQVIEGLAVLK
jgi:prolyl-tRNA editing enzyme YbaK/EbsC (Cys-tRNA(Pro) deacylase)